MRRGSVGNSEVPSVLVDYRCFAYQEPESEASFGGVLSRLRLRSPRFSWAIHPFVRNFLARNEHIVFDAYIVGGLDDPHALLRELRALNLRAVHTLRDHHEAILQIDRAGYAAMLTTDTHLLTPERPVQMFGGLTHRFI